MAARPTVPKFGNWENEQEPYTVYFDQARKYKGGKIINPNDPETFQSPSPAQSKPKIQPEEPIRRGAAAVRQMNREDGDFQQFSNRSTNGNDNMSSRGRGSYSGGPRRQSVGSDHSLEKSPIHPQHRPKVVAGRGSSINSIGSPGRSYDSSHGGIGRSRLKPESPDRAAVPKFGEWDDVNPQSAENYTEIFNKVREAKRLDSSNNVSAAPTRPSYNTQNHQQRPQKCCFPWW